MNQAGASSPPAAPHRVRWWAIGLVTLLGIGLTAAPFILAVTQEGFGTWRDAVGASLTNVGTTVFLVAVVWLLERGFTARVTKAVEETTSTVVAAETGRLQQANEDLSLRLDELQTRLEDRVAAEVRKQDEVLGLLAEAVSFENVRAALELADSLGALWFHALTVPVGDGHPNLPRFVFRWGTPEQGLWRDDILSDDDAPRLTLAHVGSESTEVVWDAGESPDAVLAALRAAMITAGDAERASTVDVSLFANLQTALSDAVSGRRAEPGSWVRGAIDEWLADGWAVTQNGLDSRDYDGLPSSAFPRHMVGSAGAMSNHEARTWRPPSAPDGVDEAFWAHAIGRARRLLPPGG